MTDFNEIYCLNLVMKNDPRLSKISLNIYYSLCWKYLQIAISRFEYESIPNIKDLVPFAETDYEFVGNGQDDTFQLSQTDFVEAPNFYITITEGQNTSVVTDYNYNDQTYSLQITSVPPENSIINVAEYQIGHFNVDLDYREKEILAQAMLIPYLEENQNRESLLNQFVYGGSVKIHSQAEQLKTITAALKEQRNMVNNLIIDYTYRANAENYSGLGTRKPLQGGGC